MFVHRGCGGEILIKTLEWTYATLLSITDEDGYEAGVITDGDIVESYLYCDECSSPISSNTLIEEIKE